MLGYFLAITANEAVYFSANMLFFFSGCHGAGCVGFGHGGVPAVFHDNDGLDFSALVPQNSKGRRQPQHTVAVKIGAAMLIFLGVWVINI